MIISTGSKMSELNNKLSQKQSKIIEHLCHKKILFFFLCAYVENE